MLLLLLLHLLWSRLPMRPSPFLENFIQSNYADNLGVNLPPLWQVIYQEAIRGHHLLFSPADVQRFDRDAETTDAGIDTEFTEELELVALRLVECSELQAMVNVIDAMELTSRRNLYFMYRRVLWMWRNYVKEQLN